MSGSTAPAAPDYSPITSALSTNANAETALAGQQQGWAANQFNTNQANTNQVVGQDNATQADANGFANSIKNQYEQTYQPLENQYATQAENYASDGNIASQMGQAASQTAQSMDQARRNSQQNLESYGISPDSTRYAALDANAEAQKGAAVAGSANLARQNTVNTGLGLESTAISQGLVQPSMVAGEQNAGLQAGSQSVNSNLATTASGASTMGTGTQYYNLANGSLGAYAGILNQGYNNQLGQFQANQQASSGIGSLIGTGASLAMMAFAKGGAVGDNDGDEGPFEKDKFYAFPGHDLQTGQKLHPHDAAKQFFRTGKHYGAFPSPEHADDHIRQNYGKAHFADGGPAVGAPLDRTQGGGVPTSASPSQGAVTDDVPADLNAGEFVMPKDTTAWYGQRHLQQMIEKGRAERAKAPAHATMKPSRPSLQPAIA